MIHLAVSYSAATEKLDKPESTILTEQVWIKPINYNLHPEKIRVKPRKV
jgi:hypothetical protein